MVKLGDVGRKRRQVCWERGSREEMTGEIDGTLLNLRAVVNFLESSGMPSKSNNQYM